MPSLLDSPPQIPAAGAGAWGSPYAAVQEPAKPRHHVMVSSPVAKKPAAYGGNLRTNKSLDMCTEALGCETGAVDSSPAAGNVEVVEAAERKRRAREQEAEEKEKRARRPLPPPLTTLVRMVHERRDGRLAVYAVPTPGVEAERSGGRLRMRLLPLPLIPCVGGAGNAAAAVCQQQESPEAEADKEEVEVEEGGEEEYGVAKYVRGGRCMETEDASAAAAARRGSKQWETEQAAAFWVATS